MWIVIHDSERFIYIEERWRSLEWIGDKTVRRAGRLAAGIGNRTLPDSNGMHCVYTEVLMGNALV